MEQSNSSEANSHSASQDFPYLFWNPRVLYHVNNILPLVLILSQIHPIHTLPIYFRKIHLMLSSIHT